MSSDGGGAPGVVCMFLISYLSGAGLIIPMLFALRRLRVEVKSDRVILSGLDGFPAFLGGIVLSVLALFASFRGALFVSIFSAVAIALWLLSFRIKVTVTRDSVRITRWFLGVLPWYLKRDLGRPSLVVDGWGDMIDPETVELHFEGSKMKFDLAFTGRGETAIAEAICKTFNDAVAAIRS